MNYETENLSKQTTAYAPGICKIFIIPLGVLPSIIRSATGLYQWPGGVLYANFSAFDIIEMDVVKESFKFRETPKEAKAGPFYEVAISAESNSLDELSRRTLETLSLKPVQVLLINRAGKSRLAGSSDRGLDLQFRNENENSGTGVIKVGIEISGQTRTTAPFSTFTI